MQNILSPKQLQAGLVTQLPSERSIALVTLFVFQRQKEQTEVNQGFVTFFLLQSESFLSSLAAQVLCSSSSRFDNTVTRYLVRMNA